ncbi:MAG: hypothetical protein U0232_14580 [Thermomicrobiales bacterium]
MNSSGFSNAKLSSGALARVAGSPAGSTALETLIAGRAAKQKIAPLVSEPIVSWCIQRLASALTPASLRSEVPDIAILTNLRLAEAALPMLFNDELLLDGGMAIELLIETPLASALDYRRGYRALF